jgi:hypothetical protein
MLHLLHLRQHSQQDKTGVFFFACLLTLKRQAGYNPNATKQGSTLRAG